MLGIGERSFKFKELPIRIITYRQHHIHHDDQRKAVTTKDIPKGYLAIKVGTQGGEQERIVVPVNYLNHPLFAQLLKEAEEEYGFAQEGAITIPCQLEEFRYVQGIIDRENSLHHLRLVGCFRF